MLLQTDRWKHRHRKQANEELVNYKGVVVDKNTWKAALRASEFFIDEDHKLPQGPNCISRQRNVIFLFKAFDKNAKMIVIWKKDGKFMGVPSPSTMKTTPT